MPLDVKTFCWNVSQVLHLRDADLCEAWAHGTNDEYSQTWKRDAGIFDQIGRKLALNCFKEYYSLDAVLFEEPDEAHFGKGSPFAQSLEVAFEHKINGASSHVELNKLSIIDAPLKVLITYATTGPETSALLERFTRILMRADTFNDFANKRKHLIVVGDIVSDSLLWEYYLYHGDGFLNVLPQGYI